MKLTFENISAAYRKKPVLESVSFSVPDGSITALVGRNGAGKSTLLRCLTGEKTDYQGSILLDGEDVRSLDTAQRVCRIAYLPQTLPCPHVTVRELVSFGRTPYTPLSGKLSDRDLAAVEKALQDAEIAELADCFVDTLSGGQRKKAFFAMTLAQDTPMVVLDEPTAHLDLASRFAFLALLEKLRAQSEKTFLIVLHDLPEVLRCADRILVLEDHHVVFDGTPEICLAEKIPQKHFGICISGSKESGYAATPTK